MMAARPILRMVRRHGVAVALALGLIALATVTARKNTVDATGDDRIVATLQQAGESYPAELNAALRASRADPADPVPAKAAARLLIAEGRAQGDSRLVGAAIGVLRGIISPDADVLYIEATARQYQHDFPGALARLDRAVAADPAHVNAILTRAFVHTVQGRFDRAEEDCARIDALGQVEVAFLCRATAGMLTDRRPDLARALEQALALPGRLNPALVPWATGLLGEVAILDGQDEAAERLLRTVIAADPAVLRERLLLADVLLRAGRAEDTLDILAPSPDVDGVLIRRVLAARMLDQPDLAGPATEVLARRVRQSLDLGLTAHAREETMYFLWIADEPEMALERARVNWAMQHEIEDAQLLLDAAMAAGEPEAGQQVLEWMSAQGVAVPTLRVDTAVTEAAR